MSQVSFDPQDPFRHIDLPDELIRPAPPLVHYEGWRQYVSRPEATKPALLTLGEFEKLRPSSKEYRAYGTARKRYHSSFGPLETNWLATVHAETLRLAAMNYNAQPGARPGVVLNGLGTVGKSTISAALGRKYERSLRKKFDRPIETERGSAFVPVIYVTLPGRVTISAFDSLILQFLAVPTRKTARESDLTSAVIINALECATSLVIVDDIHFLKMKNRSASDINNHLKYLANSISATFVYAGIDVDNSGLFREDQSKERQVFSQTSHRFKKYDISPFRLDSDDYLRVLASFAEHLLLMRQPAESVLNMATYIHHRTNGFIGSISTLLREGANLAIDNREELITQTLLDKVRLDHASESSRPR